VMENWVEQCKIYVSPNIHSNSILHCGYHENGVIANSSDYLGLRAGNGKGLIMDMYNRCKNRPAHNISDEEVVSFISSFTNGTVHGYVAIYEFILHYLKNNMTARVLLCTKTQGGIRQLVSHCIGEDKIITLDVGKTYQYKQIYFIPVTEMHFSDSFWKKNNHACMKLLVNPEFDNGGKHHLCVMKTEECNTNVGVISVKDASAFCEKNNLYFLRPVTHNEINTANLIWNCESIVFSWGTSYYKNLRYIGDKCKKIYVIVSDGFIEQYNSRKRPHFRPNSHVYKTYRNADVKYIICKGGYANLTIEHMEAHGIVHDHCVYTDE